MDTAASTECSVSQVKVRIYQIAPNDLFWHLGTFPTFSMLIDLRFINGHLVEPKLRGQRDILLMLTIGSNFFMRSAMSNEFRFVNVFVTVRATFQLSLEAERNSIRIGDINICVPHDWMIRYQFYWLELP